MAPPGAEHKGHCSVTPLLRGCVTVRRGDKISTPGCFSTTKEHSKFLCFRKDVIQVSAGALMHTQELGRLNCSFSTG